MTCPAGRMSLFYLPASLVITVTCADVEDHANFVAWEECPALQFPYISMFRGGFFALMPLVLEWGPCRYMRRIEVFR